MNAGWITWEQANQLLAEATRRGQGLLQVACEWGWLDAAKSQWLMQQAALQGQPTQTWAQAPAPANEDQRPTTNFGPAPLQQSYAVTNPGGATPGSSTTPKPAFSEQQMAEFEEARPTREFDRGALQKSLEEGQSPFAQGLMSSSETDAPPRRGKQVQAQIQKLGQNAFRAISAAPVAKPASSHSQAPSSHAPSSEPGVAPGMPAPDSQGAAPSHIPQGMDPENLAETERIFERPRYAFESDPREGRNLVVDQHVMRLVAFQLGANQIQASFVRPARMMAQMDHPSIPKVHDIGTVRGHPYYTTDHLAGRSLEKHMTDIRFIRRVDPIMRTFAELTAAVAHAHDRGIIHCHLSPEAVLVGQFGELWITHWEGAVAVEGAPEGAVQASRLPMPPDPPDQSRFPQAPEIEKGEDASEAADVWSLGLLLHWMLCKKLPGKATRRGQSDSLDDTRLLGHALPREVVAIVRKALSYRIEDRYPSVEMLGQDVTRYLDGQSVEATKDTVFQAANRLFRRYPVASSIIGGVLFVLSAVGLWTASVVTSNYRRFQKYQAEAEQEQSKAMSESAKAKARRLETQMSIQKIEARRGFSEELERALTFARQRKPDKLVIETFSRAYNMARSQGTEALNELRHARANWFLRMAHKPQAREALEDYKAIVRTNPDDAMGHLGRYIAARRLPGFEEDVGKALTDLESLPGETAVFRRLARIIKSVRKAEAMIDKARLATSARDYKAQIHGAYELSLGLNKQLKEYESSEVLPTDLIYEMQGRVKLAGAGIRPAKHRPPLPKGQKYLPWEQGVSRLLTRYALDPSEATWVIRCLEAWNTRYGLHQSWRWANGYLLSRIAESLRFIEDPEAINRAAHIFAKLHYPIGNKAFIDALLHNDVLLDAASTRTRGQARIIQARCQFALGEAARLPAERRIFQGSALTEWAFLRARQLFIEGQTENAMKAFNQGIQNFFPRRQSVVRRDLINLFADERITTKLLYESLSKVIPPPSDRDRDPRLQFFILGRLLVAGRLGQKGHARDFERLRLFPTTPYTPFWFAKNLGHSHALINEDAKGARSHFLLTESWSQINNGVWHTEDFAPKLQGVIADRLKKLGKEDLAKQFSGFDAISELWVPRYWMPAVFFPRRLAEKRSAGKEPARSED